MNTKKSTRILLCEDDPNLGTLLREFLNSKGFETDLAVDGMEGSKMYKRNTYDFLVLDVMMPVKDGFTLAEEIRQEDKRTPIIFLTAKGTKDDKMEGYNSGAEYYMVKPFDNDAVLEKVKELLG